MRKLPIPPHNIELSNWIAKQQRWPSIQATDAEEAKWGQWIAAHGGPSCAFSQSLTDDAKKTIVAKKRVPGESDLRVALETLKRSEASFVRVAALLTCFAKIHGSVFREFFESQEALAQYFSDLDFELTRGHTVAFWIP